MLRLHLPPNLAAAAARDAVPLRLEVNLKEAPPTELLPVLAILQRWCGPGQPPPFVQLSRSQLRELVAAAGAQPLFVEGGVTGPWRHPQLLPEPAPAAASPASRPAAGPRGPAPDAGTPFLVDGSEHFLALTLPSRESAHYTEALALVREHGFVLEPSNRRWWLRDRHRTLTFLATHRGTLDRLSARYTPAFERQTAHLRPIEIAAQVAPAGEDFSVTLALRAGKADEQQVRAALAGQRTYVEAGDRIFLLDAARLEALHRVHQALAGDPGAPVAALRTHRLPPARLAEAQGLLEELSPGFQPPAAWLARSAALREVSRLVPAPLPSPFETQLRPYQRLGIAWLWHLHRHGLGGVLADEMGLGKTLQALGLLRAVHGAQPATTSLVVCPASLLENWRREAARFCPELHVFVHHGGRRLTTAAEVARQQVVITSYGTLTRDQELFSGFAFAAVVADEAQHIKNRRSQNAAALRSLRCHARFVLTGTPLENSLDDLRSLFEFLLPGCLARVPAGLRGDERAWHDERLRAQTAPYILRRTKQSVAPELPAKLEHVLWCELGPEQAALYRSVQESSERALIDLEAGGASEAAVRFAALTQLLRLRQLCCDPRLLPTATAAGAAGVSSAKLEAFRELLAAAIDDGHRLLVFSQFTSLLALLRAELDDQQLPCCQLDGSMTASARQAEVDRFQADPSIPVFLLSLKAGGTGLNLTGADTVVHFDPWWNPAAEAQATDRAHRIGQRRIVTSYKLIAAGTVEEKVLALQAEKRALLAGVFEASDAASAKLSLADLKALLK
jgi:superfamily II DNA or RNA helicase